MLICCDPFPSLFLFGSSDRTKQARRTAALKRQEQSTSKQQQQQQVASTTAPSYLPEELFTEADAARTERLAQEAADEASRVKEARRAAKLAAASTGAAKKRKAVDQGERRMLPYVMI